MGPPRGRSRNRADCLKTRLGAAFLPSNSGQAGLAGDPRGDAEIPGHAPTLDGSRWKCHPRGSESARESPRLRIEDQPSVTLGEVMRATAFMAHPYGRPTIGWPSEIKGWTLEDAKWFYKTYYAPNTATLIVAGDIKKDEVLKKIYSGNASRIGSLVLSRPGGARYPALPISQFLRIDSVTPSGCSTSQAARKSISR